MTFINLSRLCLLICASLLFFACVTSYPSEVRSCPWDAATPSCSPRVTPAHRASFVNDRVYFGMQDVRDSSTNPLERAVVYATIIDLPLKFALTNDGRLRCAVESVASLVAMTEPFASQQKEDVTKRDSAAAHMRCQYWPRGAQSPVRLDERTVDCTFAPTGFAILTFNVPTGEPMEVRFMCRRVPTDYLKLQIAPPGGILWKEFQRQEKTQLRIP